MRREKNLSFSRESGPAQNLTLWWTEQEYGKGDRGGLWFTARALLCLRRSHRIIAAVAVRNDEYSIHMRGSDTIAERGRIEVEKHLQSLNLRRSGHGRFQD